MTCDGQGDGLATSVRIGEDGNLASPIATVPIADAFGSVYATVTALLGMVPLEHEYKLMGIAPDAPASGADRAHRELAGMFELTGPDGLSWQRADGVAHPSTRTPGRVSASSGGLPLAFLG